MKTAIATLWMFTLIAAPVANLAPTDEQSCEAAAHTLLDRIEADDEKVIDDQGNVVVEMDDGTQKNLGSESKPAEPRETWMGTPPSDDAAKDALAAAIVLAKDGKEKECREMLADVHEMLGIDKPESGDGNKTGEMTTN